MLFRSIELYSATCWTDDVDILCSPWSDKCRALKELKIEGTGCFLGIEKVSLATGTPSGVHLNLLNWKLVDVGVKTENPKILLDYNRPWIGINVFDIDEEIYVWRKGKVEKVTREVIINGKTEEYVLCRERDLCDPVFRKGQRMVVIETEDCSFIVQVTADYWAVYRREDYVDDYRYFREHRNDREWIDSTNTTLDRVDLYDMINRQVGYFCDDLKSLMLINFENLIMDDKLSKYSLLWYVIRYYRRKLKRFGIKRKSRFLSLLQTGIVHVLLGKQLHVHLIINLKYYVVKGTYTQAKLCRYIVSSALDLRSDLIYVWEREWIF